jgi:hypothetical protein
MERSQYRNDGPLTHPSSEEWISFLYGETDRPRKAELEKHLRACPDCREKLAPWEDARLALNTWTLPAGGRQRLAFSRWQPWLRWGIAAVFVISLGYGSGHLAAVASNNPRATRDALLLEAKTTAQREVRQHLDHSSSAAWETSLAQLRSEITSLLEARSQAWQIAAAEAADRAVEQTEKMLAAAETRNNAEIQSLVAAMQQIAAQHADDSAALQKKLETMAIMTQDSFIRAQQQIVQLAANAETPQP